MRRGIVVLNALVLSAAVACSDPRAGTLPSASPTTPTATTITPSPTADPAATLRAALAAYFDALYAAGLDPANKTDELEALIHPSCTCRRVLDVLREEARLGHHIDYRYSLSDVKVIEAGREAGHVQYTVERSAGAERDASGRVVERYAAVVEKYSAYFLSVRETWLLRRLTRFT